MEARQVGTGAPEPREIIARARALIPTLAKRSLQGRRLRRVPDETIADMQAAGFFRVLQPRRWGGYEMDLHTFYEVQLALAEGDMSTAWIYGVSGVHPWFMALLDDRAAQEVWGNDSSTLICSSLMPAGKATSSRGRLSSQRTLAICELLRPLRLGIARRPGRRRRRRPAARTRLSRSAKGLPERRHLAGFRPASHGKLGRDRRRRVRAGPSHQSMLDNFLLRGPGQALNTSSLYRLPFGQIFVRGISTAALGALQGMLNALVDYSKSRVTRAGGRSAENPFVQLLCAETAAAIDEMKSDLASQLRRPARLCPAWRDPAARGAPAIQVSIDRGHRARARCSPRASSRRRVRPAFPKTCHLAEFSRI